MQLTNEVSLTRLDIRPGDEGRKHGRAYIQVEGDLPLDEIPFGEQTDDEGNLTSEARSARRASLSVLRGGLTTLLENMDMETKISFSRKAGCSCGCSPGWILRNLNKTMFLTFQVEGV